MLCVCFLCAFCVLFAVAVGRISSKCALGFPWCNVENWGASRRGALRPRRFVGVAGCRCGRRCVCFLCAFCVLLVSLGARYGCRCRLQAAGCRLQAAGCRLQAAGCSLALSGAVWRCLPPMGILSKFRFSDLVFSKICFSVLVFSKFCLSDLVFSKFCFSDLVFSRFLFLRFSLQRLFVSDLVFSKFLFLRFSLQRILVSQI